MSEVQDEGNAVYSDVYLRYCVREILCTVMCVCVTALGNVLYSDVCVTFRLREMLCTVMCV